VTNAEIKKLVLEAKVENLVAVNEFVDEILQPLNCSMKIQMQLELAVEEIFVNIANYAYGESTGKAFITGRILENPLRLELVFMDEGTPYNPLARKDPDLEQKMEDRTIGGLGIYLVKKNVEEIAYSYQEGKNVLTLCKHIQ
jgi:anti-sigma regulatory factor (Ser/Thr protein kinase)